MITLEICVDDAAGIIAATAGGAQRLELCSALALGGLTPSAGLMQIAARGPLPVLAMIRPRAGDFVWSPSELDIQLADIKAARDAGLAGVVIGASKPDGQLDAVVLGKLVDASKGMHITLHRAVDLTPDPFKALALCRDLGIRRVLSSGGARTALEGADRLVAMQKAAAGVVIMPGGGLSAANIGQLATTLPLSEVHASCSSSCPPPVDPNVEYFGFQPAGAKTTDITKVAALRAALDRLTSQD
ncbi:copper homeostasis protein CutC [Paracoccus sp. JM45]|uniref:copper homeostasis protein CutC n=1 Tax=Paracoccus sp. JM45 TaxID=2283626 RepID=UPI000E6C7C21|nr:copper homeostasis protein CutC [Paracoccus sp. JM45]RJE78909.1 copper homeostasis protein CutC [Paracoccus sp. JM45]